MGTEGRVVHGGGLLALALIFLRSGIARRKQDRMPAAWGRLMLRPVAGRYQMAQSAFSLDVTQV
jgi:hypothetical protein